ncbi:MAG: acetolactate synthase large subunit [Methanomassiliicoccales archaeon]|jgi:acetolactate synthase-1/2/3 large subunit|nr:acetolactate synthase large subunit [Methanomassiliicoccales archaeon]
MRGSDLLVKCLENEGVTKIFGIPGEENLEVMDSLIDSGIEFILTKHEESASLMAEITALLTNEPGVCLSTLGPGATNLVTGIADSYLNYVPLVALTGQVWLERAYPPQKQYIDLVELFKPITKASLSIRASSRIPTVVRNAFDIAAQERPGPVHIELPQDVMGTVAEGEPMQRSPIEISGGDDSAIDIIKEFIESSETPMVLAGRGILRAHAEDEFREFARALNIPVAHTWMGSGLIPFDDPLSLHTVGLRTHDFMRRAFELSDLVITIGYDVLEFQPVFWNVGKKKKIVYIGASYAETAPKFSPDIQLIGNMKKNLSLLTSCGTRKDNWTSELRDQLHRRIFDLPRDESPVKPQLAVRAIRDCLGRKDIIISDVGAHLLWMEKLYQTYAERTLIASNGLLPMGIAVPGAIAAKLVCPERKVVAVCGDGGFLMTSSELETASRLKTPFTTIIFNDGGFGMIKIRQQKNFGRTIGVDFRNPDFVKYAESFGANGYRVSTAKELSEVLANCLRNDELSVIDVHIDYKENVRLIQ